MQTELDGVSYLDTEPWRGEPLLAYLRRMVFWADVVPEAADLGVLSLLGPALGDKKVLDALGIDALPDGHGDADGGRRIFVRRMLTRRGPAMRSTWWCPRPGAAAWRERAWKPRASGRPACGRTRRTGSPACGRGWASTPTSGRSRTRSAGSATAVHLDKGCYRGQETVARVHNLGKPPRMLVLTHLDGSACPAGDRLRRCSPAGARSAGSGRSSTTSISARWRSRWSSAGCRPTPR